MSIEALSYVLNTKVGDSTRKLVLLGFANHAHRDGTAAWPAVDTVAEYADCSKRTAQRHVQLLLDAGWLREGDQALVNHLRADRRPMVYNVALSEADRESWAAERRGDSLTPRDGSERGDTGDADGVTPVTPRGDTAMSPKPSKNHPDEPNDSLRSSSGTTASPSSTRGARLPADWQPDEPMREWYRQQPFATQINPVAESEKFRDYWIAQPGSKGVKIDWPATWRNWMRTAAERAAPRRHGPQHPPVDPGHASSRDGLF